MPSIAFVDKQTQVPTVWLQQVNDFVFSGAIPPPVGGTTIGLVTNTIALLRATNKLLASRVFVLGYYAQGDGGGGQYWYDSTDVTSADNGGTVIVAADGGRWKLSWQGALSVKQFGARGDGVTDDTAAFNATTRATVVWSAALQYDIFVPSGLGVKYKLNGAVYLRKGQTLTGLGHGAYIDASSNTTTSTFLMGVGLILGVPTADAGGAPVKVENFYTIGGAPTHGLVYCSAQGFEINSMFMTSPGIGIELLGAADGLISNIQIDQALTGISMGSTQSCVFTNTNTYLAGYSLVFLGSCFDISFNAGVVEYSTIAAVLFGDSVSNIKGIIFNGVNYTMNAQNAGTFQGFVQSRASNVEAQWSACSFRNMYKWAIAHQTAGPVRFTFTGCVFDGAPTNAAGYAASTTAMVLNTGLSGSYLFTGCEYWNILSELVTVNDNMTGLVIQGGRVVNCDSSAASRKRFNVVTALPNVPISVKNVAGFAYSVVSGGNQLCVLPWWGASTVWKVAIKGSTQSVADAFYSAAEESIFAVTWQNQAGTKSIYADRINLWQTANRTNPGQLGSTVCLGTAAGGAASTTTFAATGSICIAVAVTNAANFSFDVSTMH